MENGRKGIDNSCKSNSNVVLEKLKSKIEQTLQIPISKRKFIQW